MELLRQLLDGEDKMTDHFDFGDAQIYRLVETGDAGSIIQRLVPAMTAAAIRPYAARFPACADGEGHVLAPVQSFLLFADGRRILIDTGIGNGKPLCGDWGGLDTDWLDRLAAVAPPETIDTVICTHLHADHVGWNTRRQNGVWTPTFPRAAYCLPAGDLADLRARLPELSPDDVCVLRDSVEPVLAAGAAVPVPDGARAITDTVSLVPTPGHTPHHLAVRLTAGGRTLLFCGDLFYHVCQAEHPAWGAEENPLLLTTRLRVLNEAAAHGDLLFFGHMPYPLRITAAAGGYTAHPVCETNLLKGDGNAE